MLLGRGRECAAIKAVLDAACGSTPGALVLRGAPGIGTTALLEWAGSAAPSMRRISVHGSEIEPASRWSRVLQVVGALGGQVDVLGPQRTASMTEGIAADSATRRERVEEAFLGVLATAASAQPVLIAIDDARWIDGDSRAAFMSVMGRLRHERVAMLIAANDGFDDAWDGTPELVIEGLSPIDVVTLLRGRATPRVAEQLAAMTEGNPLAMLEVAAQLSPEQRSGEVPLGPVVPLGSTLSRHVLRHVDGLSADQRRVLVLVAAAPGLPFDTFRAAASGAGWDPELLETLIQPGLLRREPDGRLSFERVLMPDAVYQSMPPEERRAAHLAIAAVLTEGDSAASRAWHLAAGANRPDAVAEQALEALAHEVVGRDAVSAGAARARAAELAGNPSDVVRHLLAAGQAYALGDMNERALELFDRALAVTDDPGEQAELHLARAGPRLSAARSPRGFHDLGQMAERIEAVDRERASSLNALAALTALAAGELDRSRGLCQRAIELGSNDSRSATSMVTSLWALLQLLAGECHDATPQLIACDPPGDDVWLSGSTLVYEDLVAHALAWVGEISAASRMVTVLVEQSRRVGAGVLLARSLVVRADLYLRTGYWQTALLDAHESLALASDRDATASVSQALTVMSRLEAGLGHASDARRHGVEALATAEQSELAVNRFWAQGALGFLALAEGNGHEAIARLESARAFAEREGIHLMVAVPWAPDLVEAYVRVGRVADARRLVSELEARGVGDQCPLSAALLARCCGLVGNGNADAFYRDALVAHADVLAPFERARTLLTYGEWLRRERRLPDAVPHLEEAASTFKDLGAQPWHDRTMAELVAHGRRGASAPRRGMSALTPQEVRVARTVAGGATNRETAAALFLSTRTVEYHLSNVYRKLGVRSRSELTRRISEDPDFSREEVVSDEG